MISARPPRCLVSAWLVCLLACPHVAGPARAGGGPENLVLLVNARSEASKRIANYYIQWRQIPAGNIVYLDWKRGRENCRAEHFREEILQPAIAAIKAREIDQQIDYLVYSSDFPWRVDFRHVYKDTRRPVWAKAFASLNGATYLWHFVELQSKALLALNSNRYLALATNPQAGLAPPTRAFRSRYQWSVSGKRVPTGGQHYLLSTMLAVNTGRGNTVEEALRYLRRAAEADGRRPDGTVYFMKNGNIRSRTRHDKFPEAVQQLRRLGVSGVVSSGILPQGKQDVAGLMVGAREFDVSQANLRILPGAICEHLTSFGGVMTQGHSQTPLSAFLRHGAAGASGTVIEPTALQQKFPLPMMHVHYARGASLAEAFYQSVAAPWQLLIVGDPLCQPWALRPKVEVRELQPGQKVFGVVNIEPSVVTQLGRGVRQINLFVDGRWESALSAGQVFPLDTTELADGYHELRLVAVDSSEVQTQGRFVLPLWVDNHGRQLELQGPGSEIVDAPSIALYAKSPGASRIRFRQNHRLLGTLKADEGTLQIETSTLGGGPVRIWAEATGEDPNDVQVISKPVALMIR